MKVKDLIAKLQKCDPNATVILYSESGECDSDFIELKPIRNFDINNEYHAEYCGGDYTVEKYQGKSIVYIKG